MAIIIIVVVILLCLFFVVIPFCHRGKSFTCKCRDAAGRNEKILILNGINTGMWRTLTQMPSAGSSVNLKGEIRPLSSILEG